MPICERCGVRAVLVRSWTPDPDVPAVFTCVTCWAQYLVDEEAGE